MNNHLQKVKIHECHKILSNLMIIKIIEQRITNSSTLKSREYSTKNHPEYSPKIRDARKSTKMYWEYE